MTPVFCCGFECGQLGSVGQHFDNAGGGVISTGIVRTGNRSLRVQTAGGSSYVVLNTAILSGQIYTVRMYIYLTTIPNSNFYRFIEFERGAGLGAADIVIDTADGNKLKARAGGISGASGVAITTGVWYRLDIRANTSANPHTCELSVNGVEAGMASNSQAAEDINIIRLGDNANGFTADHYYDDFILSKTSSDYPIGAGYVNHFVPTADGTHNIAGAADFRRGGTTTDILNATTTAYQLVDDVPLDDATPDTDDHIRIVAPANATDYVECVYGAAPGISTPTVAPRAVEVIAEFFAAGTGLSDEILKLNDNGTVNDVYNGTGVAGTTTGVYKRKHYATAPTGGAWTVVSGAGNFNNIRFRYGYATDANPDKSLMCTMIEAEFAEIAAIPNKIIQVKQSINRSNSF